jgi:hypothetical protein
MGASSEKVSIAGDELGHDLFEQPAIVTWRHNRFALEIGLLAHPGTGLAQVAATAIAESKEENPWRKLRGSSRAGILSGI